MTLYDIQDYKKIISINNVDYTLQFDYAAYALCEQLCGISVYKIKEEILCAELTLKNQLILLYCGLLRNHPDFDLNILKNHPHIGHVLSQALNALIECFFTPLLPPGILKNVEKTT